MMTVETLLGLDDDRMAVLAADRWSDWEVTEPRLARVPSPLELDAWRRKAAAEDANAVLLGLARLAALDGGDDRDAALILAWLLLPTALKLRRQLGGVAAVDLDALIAAELWVVVRSVPWQKTHWLVARIAIELREAVLVECGINTRRHPVVRVAPNAFPDRVRVHDSDPDPAETLSALFEWARAEDVIGESDHLIVVSLLAAARALDEAGTLPRNGGAGGLASDLVTHVVAEELGVCQRTIRRRLASCVQALSGASSRFFDAVAV